MDRFEWGKCYEKYERLGLRAAWQLLYTTGDVQDAVQEAAAAVWRHREKLAGGEEFRKYFIGAVVNQCRKKRREYTRKPDEDRLEKPEAPETPHGAAERDELREKVRDAVKSLPGEQAEAVALCLIEEMSYADAAEAMEMSVPALRNHLFRARKALREILEEFLG